MKVLFVVNAWPDEERPWYGSWVRRQAESMSRLGVDIDPLPIRGYAGKGEYLRAAVDVRKRCATAPYDLVHANYGHSGVVARLQTTAPLIVTYCGDDLLGTRDETGTLTRRSRVEVRVFRELARLSAATITKSKAMEQHLPRGCRARNRVIPNGVDLDQFRPIPHEEARRALGWETTGKVVLFVGDPKVPGKNFELARRVVSRAADEVPNTRLEVAWELAPSDMPAVMNASNALLVTSRSEGSPNAVKEAMAVALPIVSTPVGDVEDRLRGLRRCYVRPPHVDALAEALVATLRDDCPAVEARAAISKMSLGAVARQILDLYTDVVQRSRSTPPHVR